MRLFLFPLALILAAPLAQAVPQVAIAPTMNTLSCPAFLSQVENYKLLPETIAKLEKLLLTMDKKDPNYQKIADSLPFWKSQLESSRKTVMRNRSIEMLTAQVTLDEEIRLDRNKMSDELLGGFQVGPATIEGDLIVLSPGLIHFKAIGPMICKAKEKADNSEVGAVIILLRDSQIN